MVGRIRPEKFTIPTSKGPVDTHFYRAPGSSSAVLFVGGCGGGWHNPNQGYMYPALAAKLISIGISALHLKYRHGGHLEECTHDTLATLNYLKSQENLQNFGIVGWSFGGAVVCQAAGLAEQDMVKAVATLATQSAGVEPIKMAKNCASLFIHGSTDTCLPKRCSEYTYRIAPEPRRMVIVNDHHGFFDTAKEVEHEIVEHFRQYLV